jgi:hypothetical protein
MKDIKEKKVDQMKQKKILHGKRQHSSYQRFLRGVFINVEFYAYVLFAKFSRNKEFLTRERPKFKKYLKTI